MSGEKPAPTAAEIASARDFLDDRYLDNVLSLEFPRTVDHIRTLLAALDAAEARADTAEKSLDIVRARWVEADRRANDNAERAENMRAEWLPWTKKLATAERERDEARDLARKLAQECIEALWRNCAPSLDLRDTDTIATWKEAPRG